MTSVVFPGQGSQKVGMAKDFHDNFNISKLIFEEIEDYTEINLRNIIFNNDDNKLDLTQYTQISIFAASYVIFKTLVHENQIDNNDINIMMGHSLGEYTALCCSDKITLKDCSLILKKRGELMNSAVAPNETGMAAIIGKNSLEVQEIIDTNNLDIEIANDNSSIQVVISGKTNVLNKSKELFLSSDIKKFVMLNVSAAFHSKFMNSAQDQLAQDIDKLTFLDNKIKIITNYDANIHKDVDSIKMNLKNQMANKVNWTQSIKKLEQIGENKIIEIGPSKVLSGLIKRISNNFDIISFNQVSDFK